MKGFEWVEPRTVDEALTLLGEGAMAKAGGVDLLDRMKEGLEAPARLVSLRGISGLDRIEEEPGGGLRIGPLVTLARLAEHPGVRQRFTALADAAGHAATPQIRNMATLAGNLLQRPRCWYFRQADFTCRKKGGSECLAQGGDNRYHAIFGNGVCATVHPSATAPALMVLGASLEVRGSQGTRTLKVEELFVRPDQDVRREHVASSSPRCACRPPPRAPRTPSRVRRNPTTGPWRRWRWRSIWTGARSARPPWCWARRLRCHGARARPRRHSPARS
jgi:xanthine dehydrogenase YagS FAD-binding subunit